MSGTDAGTSQRTLEREAAIEGTGLHTGEVCRVRLAPAPAGTGLVFRRGGRLAGSRPSSDPARRCTSVGDGAARILTVEHLTAAAAGLGITNLWIDVEGPEIPGLDGSAAGFVALLVESGIREQDDPADTYRLREPVLCHEGRGVVAAYPHDGYRVAYVLDQAWLPSPQVADFEVTPGTFASEIAPARTFCAEEEALRLRESGYGLGATTDNTLVIARDGRPVDNRFRFTDECARHKVLDLVGDLALLGFRLRARVIGLRSGHSLNRRLIEAIQRQRTA